MADNARRVLLVEDEYIIAADLAIALADQAIDVVGPVGNAAQALALIAAEPLDGAVLDINLNGEEAYAVADALIARRTPLVFATGYDRSAIRTPYENIPRCEKPVDARRVIDLLFGLERDRGSPV